LTLETSNFSSTLPIIILVRPLGSNQDWQEFDRGPGFFNVPADNEIRVRIKSIGDGELADLVQELKGVANLRFLDLAENRNVTNDGIARLRGLPQLTGLNLSSCTITNPGLSYLSELRRLERLELSFCNRLSDGAVKILDGMRSLTFVDLQGCLGINKGALSRFRRRTLQIYR
jgi:hypothetical protein